MFLRQRPHRNRQFDCRFTVANAIDCDDSGRPKDRERLAGEWIDGVSRRLPARNGRQGDMPRRASRAVERHQLLPFNKIPKK
jgi:hypothetical protein